MTAMLGTIWVILGIFLTVFIRDLFVIRRRRS